MDETHQRPRSAGTSSARILVASDNADDARQVMERLRSDFAATTISTVAALAVQDFEASNPDVLVLAFESFQKAQSYLIGLYRLSPAAGRGGPRIVMLCSQGEVRSAFDLCKQGTLDDYVLYWPQAQDGLRLVMSVWNAARQNEARGDRGPTTIELVSHVKQLGNLQSLLDQQVSEGQRHSASLSKSIGQAEAAVATALDDFLHRVGREEGGEVGDVKDREALARELERLKRGRVSEAFKATQTAAAPVAAWSKQLKEKLAPHLSGLLAIGEKVARIRRVVLVVDDDEFARMLIQKALAGEDYQLLFAADAAEALALLRRVIPDVILMDVNLPDTDGVALTVKIKSSPHLESVRVLMLTGAAKRETLNNSMTAGAAGFIVKPFTREALIEKLDRLFSNAR